MYLKTLLSNHKGAPCKLQSAVEASGKLDFGEIELEHFDSRYMVRGYKEKNQCEGYESRMHLILKLPENNGLV